MSAPAGTDFESAARERKCRAVVAYIIDEAIGVSERMTEEEWLATVAATGQRPSANGLVSQKTKARIREMLAAYAAHARKEKP